MGENPVFLGNTEWKVNKGKITGLFMELNNELFYKICNYDLMPPFFVSVVSNTDHWMFISTTGGMTAGRKNRDHALFPYYTDDKIHDAHDLSGNKTLFLIKKSTTQYLWEPFASAYSGVYSIQKNIYKNIYGNKLIFEEINEDLSLTFRITWCNSEKFGFVKNAVLINQNDSSVEVNVVDGIQNILPYGVQSQMQIQMSTLVDAYKKNELLVDSGIGLYTLSSVPVDKPEPSEALKATSVWAEGLEHAKILLSIHQLNSFRKGEVLSQEKDVRATRGAYFVNGYFSLNANEQKEWNIIADIDQGPSEIAALENLLKGNKNLRKIVNDDIEQGTQQLIRIVGNADGLQKTEELLTSSRHFSNVMFNVMRGGIFDDNYKISKTDYYSFLKIINKISAKKYKTFISSLPEYINYPELLKTVSTLDDADLLRLTYEYLPLTFSRRHGDPSRPWNYFSIEIKDEENKKLLSYQGNWRDIFQNWEALCVSFPEFIESIICKFVNASTADGYNPYRLTRNGIDWEVHDPHDPWSFIGYWGDHQIIYLLKFLEHSANFHPNVLQQFLLKDLFAYANVPYRIKPYPDQLADPHHTIDFDDKQENLIHKRVKKIGSDGKLVLTKNGSVYKVNLTEKLLVPLLSKLTGFIPEGGIWMNTQRPEWNDANNALVGYGVSLVTLYYLRRFQSFCLTLFNSVSETSIPVSEEVATLLTDICSSLYRHKHLLSTGFTDQQRKIVLDELGEAGSVYRAKIYANGFSENKTNVNISDIIRFTEISLEFIEQTIRVNKRTDQLYHTYNLMTLKNNEEISIAKLYEMLEGQVAVLSSGYLSSEESVEVLEALKQSAMYREDQNSYMLYPDRQLKLFKEKNNIPETICNTSELIKKLVSSGNKRLVEKDVNGIIHFNPSFNNVSQLKTVLDELENNKKWKTLVIQERQMIIDIYENVFQHKYFTGRSGTFYKYEGLGCIYWHMVSKLLLAVVESCFQTYEKNGHSKILSVLIEHYHVLRDGVGFTKTPQEYGAFPIDPYSHTPGHLGAQQPGMTGQVKEDILTRMYELGIVIKDGKINIIPILLRKNEFLSKPDKFMYIDLNGKQNLIDLETGTLGITFCQIPFKYILSDEKKINIFYQDGSSDIIQELSLTKDISRKIFSKTNEIEKIFVYLNI